MVQLYALSTKNNQHLPRAAQRLMADPCPCQVNPMPTPLSGILLTPPATEEGNRQVAKDGLIFNCKRLSHRGIVVMLVQIINQEVKG